MRRIGRFFLYLFASVGTLVTLLFISAIVIAVTFDRPKSELPERIVLQLDLDKGISDSRSDDPWRRLRGDEAVHLFDIVETLEVASSDERVVGLAIRLGAARIGLAHAQEIRDSITAFRSRGKFVATFAQTFGGLRNGTAEYYLAASADEIWMQPSGQLGLLGIALETPYLRRALDKVGVRPEFEQRHEYKSGIELFTQETMSEPTRQSLTQLVGSWMGQIVSGIAEDRGLLPGKLRQLVDRSPLLASEARNAQLIDHLGYWDDFIEAVEAKAGKKSIGLKFAYYAAQSDGAGEDATDVAMIYGTGPIQSGEAENSLWGSEVFAAESVVNAIDAATADESIAAILMRIDSPGGSYIGSDTVRHAVIRAKKKGKPVIASMGQYGASGGYFVAAGADKIVAQPGTITGSIGVFGGKLATADLWDKLGISWSRVSVGANAGMWSQIYPFLPSAADRHRVIIDFVYDDFTSKVTADRTLPEGRIDAVARGRICSGADAQQAGLVDALGGYAVAAGLVRNALRLSSDAPLNFVVLPAPRSVLDHLRDVFSEGVSFTQALATLISVPEPDTFDDLLRSLEQLTGDISVLRRPAGLLQLPPMRLAQ